MRGICLREDEPPISFMAEHDQAEGTACPRLQEIHFDTEAISPGILEGLETPVWRVMEDSQAIQTLDGTENAAVYEDCNLLDESTLERHSPVSSNSITLNQHVEKTSRLSGHSTPLIEATQMRQDTAQGSCIDHSQVTRFLSENSKTDSSPHEDTSHEVEARMNSVSNDEREDDEEESSLAVHRKPCNEVGATEGQHSVEQEHPACLEPAGQKSSQSKSHDATNRVDTEPDSIPNRIEEIVSGDEQSEQTPRLRVKRSKRIESSSHSLFPSKKTKTGHNPSLEDSELGEDTTVVRSRSTNRTKPPTNANYSLPQSQSESRSREFELPRQYSGEFPRILFSSTTEIDTKKKTMAFLRGYGGKAVKTISTATMLCLGSDKPLKKTANLVLAVCLGLDIVTDKWLVESQRKGFLLDPDLYLPKDPEREREWDFKLHEAIGRGRLRGGLSGLLNGLDVYFTHGLKSLLAHNFRDFGTVATCLGADAVRNGLPNGKEKKAFLILGTANDPQTLRASRMGHEVWSKDLLVMGALRGTIQRIDEFNIAKPMKQEDM
jgi:hypothetical protein